MNLSDYPTDALITDIKYTDYMIAHLQQAIASEKTQTNSSLDRSEVSRMNSVLMSIAQAGEQFKADKMSHYFNDFFDSMHDWHGLADFRQRVMRGYETVDEDIVWLVLDEDVPDALEAAEYVLEEMRRELSRRDV